MAGVARAHTKKHTQTTYANTNTHIFSNIQISRANKMISNFCLPQRFVLSMNAQMIAHRTLR